VFEVGKINDADVEEAAQEMRVQRCAKEWERKDAPWTKMATQSKHREGESMLSKPSLPDPGTQRR
jgi:hypothetical protein